jgi:hypothetical protein
MEEEKVPHKQEDFDFQIDFDIDHLDEDYYDIDLGLDIEDR